LGEATVRRLAAAGAVVTVVDFNEERGRSLVTELGSGSRFQKTDVTDGDQVAEAVAVANEAAPLRVAVCCAGVAAVERSVARDGRPHDPATFARVININLIGTFHVLSMAAAAMAGSDPLADGERGVIVTTASVAAYDGQIGQIAYAASKGGVVAMTLPAARDLAPLGIRVCTIAPGLMETPLLGQLPEAAKAALAKDIVFPKRLGRPDDYASMALYIIEQPYLNGETIRLDAALRMPPK
jgi:NAD(P)-dependent dehydrogenase (short-subunit alcohol dehydrogenase family)